MSQNITITKENKNHTKKIKTFPCPHCHGKGGEIDPIMDDGSGPYYPCDLCDDERFIEVDSELHWCIRRDYFLDKIFHIRNVSSAEDEELLVKKVEEIIDILKRTIDEETKKNINQIDDIPF